MQTITRLAIASENRLCAEALAEALARYPDLRFVSLSDLGGGDLPEATLEIALLDLALGKERVLQLLAALTIPPRPTRAIVFGLERESDLVLDLVEAGASGYLLRQSSPADLVALIRAVSRGEATCSPWVAARVAERIHELSRHQPQPVHLEAPALTTRELEVLHQMTRGMRNKEIGRSLSITVQTVKNHVHAILEKLQVHRRREAVRLGLELGLVHEVEGSLERYLE